VRPLAGIGWDRAPASNEIAQAVTRQAGLSKRALAHPSSSRTGCKGLRGAHLGRSPLASTISTC
jgi:hypothetical protein